MAMTDQQRRQILANEDLWIMLITLKICQEQTLMAIKIKLMWEDLFAAQLLYLDGTIVQSSSQQVWSVISFFTLFNM